MMYTGMGGMGISTQAITTTVGGSILAAAPFTGPAAPFVAAAGALTTLIGSLFRPDITKIEASNIVNQIEAQYLKPNLAMWNSLPADQKTESAQAAALNLFDQAWAAVKQGCGNPQLGTAGQNCITDRQQGSCHYTIDGQTPVAPPNCGNWFVWYRDPIANDPDVIPDPVLSSVGTLSSDVSQAFQSGSPLPLLIAAGLLVWAVS